jgi:hypothetical protein
LRRLLAAAVIALGVSGCAATHETGHGARDLTITNQPDMFELHWGSLRTFSNRISYKWTNTGTKARVRQASSVVDGDARIEVRDPRGTVVHSKNLREQGSFITFAGTPGTWKITVIMDNATGSLTFEVRKNT